MKKIKISQSLIKDYEAYLNEEICGFEFTSKYIDKTWNRKWNDSPAKKVGRYFEWILTGGMPTGYDTVPEPEWMKSALKKPVQERKVSDMMSEYRRAHTNADRIRKLLAESGIVIQSVQVYRERGIMEGNIDVEAALGKKEINIDIKYSGLLDNKWDKFGWAFINNPSEYTEKQNLYNGIQAKQYTALNGRPTYFLIVSNANETDVEFFEAELTQEQIDAHISRAEQLIDNIAMINDVGWNNYPSLKKCSKCPLASKCNDKITTLVPKKVIMLDYA